MTRASIFGPIIGVVVGMAAIVAIPGCSEKPQIAATNSERKADAKAFTGADGSRAATGWNGADPAYTAPGWKAGDEASWQQQLRQRAQSQNEYVRVGSKKSGS